MAETTANRGYAYPESGDNVNLWEWFEGLAGDVDADVHAIVNKPVVRLVQQAAQALADGAAVAVTFGSGSEEIDTHNFHSTSSNTTRVTPTIAGIYRATGFVFFEIQSSPVVSSAYFRKNGTTAIAGSGRGPGAGVATSYPASALVEMNGSGDYLELIAVQDSGGNDNTNVSSQFSSVFELEYVRPLP